MKNIKNWIIGLVVLGLFGWALYTFVDSTETKKEQQSANAIEETDDEIFNFQPGDYAPDFELKTFDGQTVRLSDYKGKAVMLNFWATWCPPCRAEIPDMQKVYETTDYEILAVNVTGSESKMKHVEQFIEKYDMTFPVALDEASAVSTMYNAFSLPTTYFIDEEGKIVQIIEGPLNKDAMIQMFQRIEGK